MCGMWNCGVNDSKSFKPDDVKDSDPCFGSESEFVDSAIALPLVLLEDPKVHCSLEVGCWFSEKILWSTSSGRLAEFTGRRFKCFETRRILDGPEDTLWYPNFLATNSKADL